MKPLMLSALVALGLSSPAVGQSADPSGTWLTPSQDTKVRIARCGGAYCGAIVSSTYQKDVNNQDPTKRDRPVVGLQMIYDLKPSADGMVGQLYNPQDGKTYT